MYEQYWGLSQSPFRNADGEFAFYGGAGRDEAIARLLFLAENNRQLGFFSGNAGTGKSLVLTAVENDLAREMMTVVRVNLTGIDGHEFLQQILVGLGIGNALGSISHFQAWRLIEDELLGLAAERRQTVFLLDHWERVHSTAQANVERLLLSHEETSGSRTVILAGRDLPGTAESVIGGIADIHVRVEKFAPDETAEYVQSLLEYSGSQSNIFDEAAVACIHRISDGVPRRINRLCDHALLAGMVENRSTIGEEIIRSVSRELGAETTSDDRYRLLHEPLSASLA